MKNSFYRFLLYAFVLILFFVMLISFVFRNYKLSRDVSSNVSVVVSKVDSVISFLIQVFSSFPFLLFAMAIMFVLGPGLINLYLALGLLGWASTARLIRGDVMRLKKMEYIDACKVSGGNSFRIIMKHLLPNCLSTLIVTVTLGIPNAIMSEASLSFLGLGVKAPMASWGSMISFSQPYIRSATYYSVIPGLAIIITVLAFNMLGDGLRDALDPKLRS